jgi:hypothetical protein
VLDPPKPRRLDQPIAVSREDWEFQGHLRRYLEMNLDLNFTRD